MFNCPGLVSSEMRYPTNTSKKKKRYVTFKCEKCGTITEKVYQKNRYVPICESCGKGGKSTEEFIAIGKRNFGNKYDYSKVNYTGCFEQVTIICPIHGKFSQRANEHIQGHGCIQCAQEQRKIDYVLPKETWIERIKKYPNVSFKDPSQIKNYHGYVDLICKIHGEFRVQLGSVGQSIFLCAKCAYHSHQLQSVRPEHIGKDAWLYYVYLPEIDMYKFGITLNKEERFRTLGMEVVLLADGTKEYTEAVRLEHKVFTTLDKYRYKGGKKLLKNGSTELFKHNVIKQIKRALRE